MKPILLSLLLVGTAFGACSQEIAAENVPSVVRNTFKARFSQATAIEWKKASENYSVEFTHDSTEYEALLDATGKLLMLKQDIALAQLPGTITDALAREHKGFTVDDLEKVEKDGLTYYQVELEKRFRERQLVYTADGTTPANIAYWE